MQCNAMQCSNAMHTTADATMQQCIALVIAIVEGAVIAIAVFMIAMAIVVMEW